MRCDEGARTRSARHVSGVQQEDQAVGPLRTRHARPVRGLREHERDPRAVLDRRRPRRVVVRSDDDRLVVGAGELGEDVPARDRLADRVDREPRVDGSAREHPVESSAVAAAHPHAGDRARNRIVRDVVVLRIARVVGEDADEAGRPGRARRVHHRHEFAPEGQHLRRRGERLVGIVGPGGEARHRRLRHAHERDVAERDAAANARGIGLVEGHQRRLDGRRRRMRQREARDRLPARAVGRDRELGRARLPGRELDRLVPDALEPECRENIGDPALGPAVGGMAGTPHALGDDLLDPSIDLWLRRNEIVAHRQVTTSCRG